MMCADCGNPARLTCVYCGEPTCPVCSEPDGEGSRGHIECFTRLRQKYGGEEESDE